jgi:exonuclease III
MSTLASRKWRVLCWNVRGLNAKEKWDAIRDKITESQCDIVCLQETKRDNFDAQYFKNFVHLLSMVSKFLPSVGASGGIHTIWKST